MFGIFSKFRDWAIGIGAFLAAIAWAILLGFRKGTIAGANTIEVKSAQATNTAVVKANTVTQQVSALPTGKAQEQLNTSWSRD